MRWKRDEKPGVVDYSDLLALVFLFAGGVKLVMPAADLAKAAPMLTVPSCDSSECARCWALSA